MKRRYVSVMTIAVFALGTVFVSCKKDKTNNNNLTATQVNDIPADTIIGIYTSGPATGQPYGSGKFTFFSLERNEVVAHADSATTKWDLAFRGTTILTNGGTSGPASGGAFVYVGTFDGLSSVPADSVFRTDNAPTYAIKTGSGNGWYSYNGATQLITPIPGRILVIRTASGKYAKVEIMNYYKGGVTPDASASDNDKLSKQRYYTFRYTFQSNGSMNF
ncbi:MAG: hypothetical protein GC171_09360 [Terrimonas sp.]|nr:hypothetical protein [Terrimonas sp.]